MEKSAEKNDQTERQRKCLDEKHYYDHYFWRFFGFDGNFGRFSGFSLLSNVFLS